MLRWREAKKIITTYVSSQVKRIGRRDRVSNVQDELR